MARQQAYEKSVPGSPDIMRVRFVTQRGQVLVFTVQYETWIEGRFRPVVRFDSQHGRSHRDILGWDGETIRKDWDWEGAYLTVGEALTRAEDEIKENWRTYQRDFLRRKP